jgi:hypothetical protein
MKLNFISDTHNSHNQMRLDRGDILFHSGDVTFNGTDKEFFSFVDWFSEQPFDHKVFIAGNHDYFISHHLYEVKKYCESKNVHYLQDELIELNGLKIWGTPWMPVYKDMSFNLMEHDLRTKWNLIPKDVDILLTHTPPHTILDYVPRKNFMAGSETLLEKVLDLDFMINAFGHIHEGNGIAKIGDKLFINAVPQMQFNKYNKIPYNILQYQGTRIEI